jgi:hypothetical protein
LLTTTPQSGSNLLSGRILEDPRFVRGHDEPELCSRHRPIEAGTESEFRLSIFNSLALDEVRGGPLLRVVVLGESPS